MLALKLFVYPCIICKIIIEKKQPYYRKFSSAFAGGDMMRRGDMHERAGTFSETDPILGTFAPELSCLAPALAPTVVPQRQINTPAAMPCVASSPGPFRKGLVNTVYTCAHLYLESGCIVHVYSHKILSKLTLYNDITIPYRTHAWPTRTQD